MDGDSLAETNSSGTTTSEYTFFAGQRLDRIDVNGNIYTYFMDELGSTRTITDSTGHICYDADFTPYGQEILPNNTNTCPQNYKFTGYERDSETGLDYAFARYYNPRLGRFMSSDPLGGGISDPQTLNRYAYVRNDATDLIDPSGMQQRPPGWTEDNVVTFYLRNSFWGNWDVFDVLTMPLVVRGEPVYGRIPGTETVGEWQPGFVVGSALDLFPDSLGPTGGGRSGVGQIRTAGPCKSKSAGDLDYQQVRNYRRGGRQTAEQHILARHINPASGASQYIKQPPSTPKGIWELVLKFNAETFAQGVGFSTNNGYRFEAVIQPVPDTKDPNAVDWIVGETTKGRALFTNTLYVDKNCKTVQSSHPGLP